MYGDFLVSACSGNTAPSSKLSSDAVGFSRRAETDQDGPVIASDSIGADGAPNDAAASEEQAMANDRDTQNNDEFIFDQEDEVQEVNVRSFASVDSILLARFCKSTILDNRKRGRNNHTAKS